MIFFSKQGQIVLKFLKRVKTVISAIQRRIRDGTIGKSHHGGHLGLAGSARPGAC